MTASDGGKTWLMPEYGWFPFDADTRITSGCSKRLSSKAAARSATRRIMSVTFADVRESVSAQCLRGEA